MNSYTFHITFYDLFFFAMIFVGLTFALLLGFVKTVNRSANRFLALALVIMILWMARAIAIDIRLESYLPHWDWLPLQFSLALGPLMYFYVRRITCPQYKFRPKDALHFSPLLLELAALAIEISESNKAGAATYATHAFQQLNPVLQLLIFISIITYLHICNKLIQSFYRRLQPVLMDRPLIEFRWLRRLLAATALLWSLWIACAAVDFFGYGESGIHVYYPFYIFFAVIIIWTAAAAFLRPQAAVAAQANAPARPQVPAEMRAKGIWLKTAIEANRYYEDPELSLSFLAEKLSLSPHELSRVINTAFKKSFNDFINEYRVREVARKMQDAAYDNMTLLGVAFESGFNSRTTFHRIFKQVTGKSPAEHKIQQKKEIPSYNLESHSGIAGVISNRQPTPIWADKKLNHNFMFRNYLKIALRNLASNKVHSFVNIAGLTFGLACFLLIGLYLYDELTFDQQHHNAARIYRVVEHINVSGEISVIAAASYKLASESKAKIAGVENTTRLRRLGRANIFSTDNPTNFFQETVTAADQPFLEIFDFPLLAGDRNTALKEPNAILLTQDMAVRLFGKTDVVGKTIQFSFLPLPLKVTGVLKNHPRNSSFDFNSIMSEASFFASDFYKQFAASDWLSENFSVYALLKPGVNAGSVERQMSKLVHDNFKAPPGTSFSFSLQPLQDMHLGSEHIVDGARNSNVDPIVQGSSLYIKIFSFIAFFLLVIAGINYMNLTTAKASGRLKEIGVRKTVGALRANLLNQFLFESLLVTLVSFALSLLVVNLLLPAFNRFTNKELSLGFSTDYHIWLYAVCFAVITGLLSGSYPAIKLSRFKPVLLLKGMKLQNKTGLSLRKGLVIFQFSMSVIMIIATVVLFLQVKYMNNKDLGFNKNLLVVIDVNTLKARSNFEVVKVGMAAIPAVKDVSVTSRVPGEWKNFRTVKIKNHGSTGDPLVAYMFGADKDFLKTYQIKLASGRNFGTPADSSSIILNETAAKMLGIMQPSGQLMEMPEMSENGGSFFNIGDSNVPFRPRVVGIVKDFHFQSLHNKIEPLVLGYNINPVQVIDYYTARIAAANIKNTLDRLKEVMVKNDKSDPFEYHFLDSQLALFYLEDQRRQTILIWAALATIFIACLGLFGLASYEAEQKVKEIGIRKVLGATVFSLTSLLSKDFLKLVLIANAIAFPIAWWAVSQWLQQYAYHITIQWWIFGLAGVSACIIAALTIAYQSIKAAMSNPVKSLRSE